jgi:hypothetical protein
MAGVMISVSYSSMVGSTKVEEDGLSKKIGDAMIKEERIPKAKFSFPFVLNRQCVMRIRRNN